METFVELINDNNPLTPEAQQIPIFLNKAPPKHLSWDCRITQDREAAKEKERQPAKNDEPNS